jgi:hypothetical protein
MYACHDTIYLYLSYKYITVGISEPPWHETTKQNAILDKLKAYPQYFSQQVPFKRQGHSFPQAD